MANRVLWWIHSPNSVCAKFKKQIANIVDEYCIPMIELEVPQRRTTEFVITVGTLCIKKYRLGNMAGLTDFLHEHF